MMFIEITYLLSLMLKYYKRFYSDRLRKLCKKFRKFGNLHTCLKVKQFRGKLTNNNLTTNLTISRCVIC